MAGRGLPYNVVAINGTGYATLQGTTSWRRNRVLQHSALPVLVMTGGTGDIANDLAAADVLELERVYAQTARDAGAKYVICATITPYTPMTSPENTQRLALNNLIRGVVGDPAYWDACFDVAGDARLQNTLNTTYYVDGTHWTQAGFDVAAGILNPLLDVAIAAL